MIRNARKSIFLAATLLCACTQDDRLTVIHDSGDKSTLICDVRYAKFKVPKTWQPNSSTGKTYAILTKQSESYPNVSQLIKIDIGKPADTNAKLAAERFAKMWKGKVLSETVTIDKEKGFRIRIPPSQKDLQPIDCVVVFHAERAFLLMAGGNVSDGLSQALDEVIASWTWKR
jgi:hypothetical protein